MLVSVITSVYNCQDYVGEMLDSILNQTLQDWECIIIDDASTDNTWNMIKQYNDKRIIAIQNQENEGLTRNLNKGIAYAKGKYIIRIDGDDKAYPTRFEKQVHFMEDDPQIVVSGSYMQNFGQRYDVVKAVLENDKLRVNMLFNSVIYHPTFIIRKDILDQFHICYDEAFQFAQDYHLLYQLMQHGKIANLPEVLMKRRVHGGQIGRTKYEQQQKCADITRKLMLKLLGIELTKYEEQVWFKWCVYNTYNSIDEEKILQLIQEKILDKNKKRKIFNQDILMAALQEKKNKSIIGSRNEMKKDEDKYLPLFLMMNQWVRAKQAGRNVAEYLGRKGYEKVAIYGIGYAGETLLSELEDTKIEIVYLIDKNAGHLFSNIPMVTPDNISENADVIIVTAITFFDGIVEKLRQKTEIPVVSLAEILFDL